MALVQLVQNAPIPALQPWLARIMRISMLNYRQARQKELGVSIVSDLPLHEEFDGRISSDREYHDDAAHSDDPKTVSEFIYLPECCHYIGSSQLERV